MQYRIVIECLAYEGDEFKPDRSITLLNGEADIFPAEVGDIYDLYSEITEAVADIINPERPLTDTDIVNETMNRR